MFVGCAYSRVNKMENSAYVPSSPLPPPAALVVFSQAGGGSLSDALRMQRPFNPQIPEATKELHLPFSGASSFGYPHLLHHLQPQHFLHPALDPRITFGSQGAFRPLSAFAPPLAAKLKEEASCSSRLFSPELLRESSPELSASPPELHRGNANDESMSAAEESRADTPGSERSTPEEGRGFRRE
ncbi:hypothetical protein B566_EDAN008726 [Ephemera danica]|nr:hypothetical protein B566_EDAN008726 [Ephemera danica]